VRTVLALIVLVALTATQATAGSCGREKSHACKAHQTAVNLNLAPDLAQKIVADDPLVKPVKRPAYAPADPAPYNGPSIGVPPHGRGATVGYRWSTD